MYQNLQQVNVPDPYVPNPPYATATSVETPRGRRHMPQASTFDLIG